MIHDTTRHPRILPRREKSPPEPPFKRGVMGGYKSYFLCKSWSLFIRREESWWQESPGEGLVFAMVEERWVEINGAVCFGWVWAFLFVSFPRGFPYKVHRTPTMVHGAFRIDARFRGVLFHF